MGQDRIGFRIATEMRFLQSTNVCVPYARRRIQEKGINGFIFCNHLLIKWISEECCCEMSVLGVSKEIKISHCWIIPVLGLRWKILWRALGSWEPLVRLNDQTIKQSDLYLCVFQYDS